jgi:carboxyl-terminal processing protease
MNRLLYSFSLFFISVASYAQSPTKAAEKFKTTLNIVSAAYVDTVDADKLVEDAIIGMLDKLDPHSVYISKEEVKEMNEPLIGNFEGVGIQFQILKDTILVVNAIPGGPSEKLGIQAGDKIIKVNDTIVAGIGIKNNDVIKKLRGDKGTKVKVAIKRGNNKELIDYEIIRDKIPIYSVDAWYMATPEIGYIRITRFAQTTMEEYEKAIRDLKSQGMKSLILDLRGNGGGFLHVATALADEFLPDKKLIVYTEGSKQSRQDSYATSRGNFESGKLVVLIDEASASASEIVSGAIQDWDRGLIIGRRSFGKGLVQKPYNLPDGSMLRLTTARYYTPSGRCIQKPYEEGKEAYYKDLSERFKHGELLNADSIKLPDSLKYQTLVNKRTVYGGGGIMPDIFVPLDTSFTSEFYTKIQSKGLQSQFVLTYLEKYREELKKQYPDAKSFRDKFTVSNELFNEFLSYAEKEEIKAEEEHVKRSRKVIEMQIKALIGRNLFNESLSAQIFNDNNEAYLKALEVLQDKTFEKMKIKSDGKYK